MNEEANRPDEININISISRGFISIQVAILLGCIALWIFSNSDAVKGLIIVSLLLDSTIILLYFISKWREGKESKNTEDASPDAEPVEEVEVPRKRKKNNRATVCETDAVIKNKVPIPTAQSNQGFAEETSNQNNNDTPVNVCDDINTDWSDFY